MRTTLETSEENHLRDQIRNLVSQSIGVVLEAINDFTEKLIITITCVSLFGSSVVLIFFTRFK